MKKMKEKYEVPAIELVELECEDVILYSIADGEEEGDEEE